MKVKINKSVWKASITLLITINIFFALNYFFHFAMARMLPVAEYGILVVLYSIMYIFGVFTESIQTIISKYTTEEKNEGKLKNILKKSMKKASKISFIMFISYLLISIFLSFLLKIEYYLLALTGTILFASFLLPIGRGFLQGKKKFVSLGWNMILESLVKLVLAIFFVFIGWMVFGAVLATIIGIFISLLASLFVLRKTIKHKEIKSKTTNIYGYTKPVLISMLAIILFLSLDVIFARFFFSPEVAGFYAISSTISKIIYFGTLAISKAMFPLATESKKKSDNVLGNAFFLLCFALVVALIIIYFFSDLLIRIYAGRFIVESAVILIYPAIAISLLSLTNLIILHKLSKGTIKNYWVMFIFIIIQGVLFFFFHDNLVEFSLAFVTSSAAFLWGSIFLLNGKT